MGVGRNESGGYCVLFGVFFLPQSLGVHPAVWCGSTIFPILDEEKNKQM